MERLRHFLLYRLPCLRRQFTFSDDTEFNLLALADMVLLAAVAMLERADLRQYHDGSFRSIADLCYMIFALTFGKLGQAFYTLFHSEKSGEKRKLGSVLLGILTALPVLAVVIPLLASSDAAFSAMLEHWLSFDYIGEAFIVLIFGLALFLLLFGRLVSLPHVRRSDPPCSSGSGLEPTVVIAFLGAIAAVYVLYLFSQLAYFFNAFSGLLPEKFTVAEYARRGFFEMTLISAFNLGILLLSYLICRKKDGRTPMAVRVLSLLLCLFSLVLSVTVLSKLRLYIGSFGMTRLRIVTSVFTVFLIAVFLSVAVRLFVKKMPYMKVALVVGTALLLVCGFVGTIGRSPAIISTPTSPASWRRSICRRCGGCPPTRSSATYCGFLTCRMPRSCRRRRSFSPHTQTVCLTIITKGAARSKSPVVRAIGAHGTRKAPRRRSSCRSALTTTISTRRLRIECIINHRGQAVCLTPMFLSFLMLVQSV